MALRPWSKFYWADWRADPRLRMCSLSARGLWVEMCGLAHEAEPYGHVLVAGRVPSPDQLASLVGAPLKAVLAALKELDAAEVFSRTPDGVIYSRRMVRDREREAKDVAAGLNGGNPNIRRGTVPKEDRVRPFKRTDAPNKTLRVFNRDHGHCYWCGGQLAFDSFHIDHVVAICDGGTNEESNLVAACADCNHRRAQEPAPAMVRHQYRVSVGSSPDTKAHMPEARSQIDGDEARARFAALGKQVLATVGALDDPSCRLDYSRVKAWLDAGYDADHDILPCVAEVMRNKRDGPPGSLKYFDKPLAKWHRDRTEPPAQPPKNGPSHAGQSEQLRRRTAQFAGLAAAAESLATGEDVGPGVAALPKPGTAGRGVEIAESGLSEGPVRLSVASGRAGH